MIRDFIKIFKKAYAEYYKDRIEANDTIKYWKGEMIYFKNKRDLCDTAQKSLSDLYLIFPKKSRQDFVQKTLDLLEYWYGCGINIKYRKQLNLVYEHIRRAYVDMLEEYNDKNYDKVMQISNVENLYLKNWYMDRDMDYPEKPKANN